MGKILTNDQVVALARSNGIIPAALLAVRQVESGNRSGFLSSGRPQILFEGHIFYKYLKSYRKDLNLNELMKKYPTLIYKYWTKIHYRGGEDEWNYRLLKARDIDENLANMSASWGMFQVMGFNYKLCNCSSIESFVKKMESSGLAQLELTLNFLRNTGIIQYLNKLDWTGFAKRYNGSGYAQNRYHIKLETYYKKYVKLYP